MPIERALAPVYRSLLRARATKLGVLRPAEGNPGASGVAFEPTLCVTPFPASADEVGRLFRAYVGEIPVSAFRFICTRPELLGLFGQSALEP